MADSMSQKLVSHQSLTEESRGAALRFMSLEWGTRSLKAL